MINREMKGIQLDSQEHVVYYIVCVLMNRNALYIHFLDSVGITTKSSIYIYNSFECFF